MKYAIFKSGGKQYKVTEGDILEVERLQNAGKEFTTSNVLLYASEGTYKIGNPYVSGMVITGKILGDTKGIKVKVIKYKSKVRYRRAMGSRQSLTKIQIEKIGEAEQKNVTKAPRKKAPLVKK